MKPKFGKKNTFTKKESKNDWKACRIIDERSEMTLLGIDFPTNLATRRFETFDDDLADKPDKLRKALKSNGARFPGIVADQLKLVGSVISQLSDRTEILAMKPGFRNAGFVLGSRMLGAAKGKYRWKASSDDPDIGDAAGSLAAWQTTVGRTVVNSYPASLAQMAALAASLP